MTPTPEATAERWRVDLGDAFGRLEPEAFDDSSRRDLPGHGLSGDMSGTMLGRTGVFSVSGTPQVVRRTQRAIAAAPVDPLKICIQLAGSTVVRQTGREVAISAGQLALYDTGRPYDLRLAGHWRCAVATVPRDALSVTDNFLDSAMRYAFPATDGPAVLLTGLIEYALRSDARGGLDSGARAHLGEAGIQLVASLLETACDGASHDAELREAVLAYVRGHLRDPDLCHGSVAAAHHMSPRSLHRLFEHEARTVTDTIRSLRLGAVRTELTDARWRGSPVMVVASRWGFRDQAHFTRAFKSEFGLTPAAARRL